MSDAPEHRSDWQDEVLRDVVTKWILGRSQPEKITARILLVSLGISFNFRSHATMKRRRGKFVMARLGRIEVASVRVPPGTLMMESVLAVAARTPIRYCLGIGAVGALDPSLSIGDVLLPEEAYCGDGLSKYYPGSDIARPDPKLSELVHAEASAAGLPLTGARLFTTASLCTESDAFIEKLRGEGYQGLECQVAPFYRVAKHYGLEPLALVTVSDSPGRRQIFFKDRRLTKTYEMRQNAAFAVIESMAQKLDSHGQQRQRRRLARRTTRGT